MQCIAVYILIKLSLHKDCDLFTLCVTMSSHQFQILKKKKGLIMCFLFSPLINFCFDSWITAKRECHCVHRYLVYVRNDKARLDKHLSFFFDEFIGNGLFINFGKIIFYSLCYHKIYFWTALLTSIFKLIITSCLDWATSCSLFLFMFGFKEC